MDLNRLSRGEQILGICAALLFLTSFLPMWGKVDVSAEGVPEELLATVPDDSFSLWSGYGFLPKLGVIIALVLVVVVLAKLGGGLDSVSLPVPLGLVYLGGAAIVVITMLIALVAGAEGQNEVSFAGVTYEAERGLLLYLGVVLSVVMAFGAFMHFQGEGGTASTTTGRPGTPPPPPGA